MREPVPNETVQLGIVVRDLEATVRRYVDDYGIGPWEFAQIDAGDANNYREYGRPVERSTRIAVATVGRVMWELIEPLDEEAASCRPLRTAGARWAGRPGSSPRWGWPAIRPVRALCPGRCRGTAACPGRRPRDR
jgi:Glyoxalase/Bleomycin resistance protein/Dioxygenase superfamily